MKIKKILLTGIYMIVAFVVAAQPCTLEDKLKRSGYWTPGMPGSTAGIAPADLTKQKAVVTKIFEPIQKKYTPRGLDIIFGGAYSKSSRLPENVKPGNYYYAYCYFVEHPCVYTKEAMADVMSSFSLTILANDMGTIFGRSFFVPTAPNEENPYSDAFALFEEKPVQKDGAWYWREGKSGNSDFRWVISYDNKEPFLLVTKKEFAERLKAYYQKRIKKADTDFAETLKSNEGTYQNLKKFNAQEAEKFKEQGKVQAEKMRDIEKDRFTKSLQVVEGILASADATTLAEPALVDQLQSFDDFKGFAKPGDAYTRWVVKLNMSYFNPQLPKSSPQFFTVQLTINESNANLIAKTASEEIVKAVDFAALKSLIGK